MLRCTSIALAIALAAATVARADGAFPDSMQILVPADRPHSLILGTNFGLLFSDDDGATWRWVCEQAIAPLPSLFQIGPPPGDTLFAVATTGLARSTDGACDWTLVKGCGPHPVDVFPDPTDGTRVLAIGDRASDGGATGSALYASHDGGAAFALLYAAPDGVTLTGVEIARSAPQVVYLTGASYDSRPPRLYVFLSSDGGASFFAIDETAALPAIESIRLAAVDPKDPETLYLLAQAAARDALAISNDGGATLRIALPLDTRMSAFLRRESGELLVGTGNADLFASQDGGKTFSRWPSAPHIRALGERGATLYLVADTFVDPYAVGVSTDDGATISPLFQYSEICGVVDCPTVAATCAAPWSMLVDGIPIMSAPACFAGDGGGATPDFAHTVAAPMPNGCSCAIGGASHPRLPIAILLLLALLRARTRRPTSSGRSRRCRRWAGCR